MSSLDLPSQFAPSKSDAPSSLVPYIGPVQLALLIVAGCVNMWQNVRILFMMLLYLRM